MIIDTSALIAILRDETGAKACALAIERTVNRRLSAANFVETALVIDGSRDPIASQARQTRCCASSSQGVSSVLMASP